MFWRCAFSFPPFQPWLFNEHCLFCLLGPEKSIGSFWVRAAKRIDPARLARPQPANKLWPGVLLGFQYQVHTVMIAPHPQPHPYPRYYHYLYPRFLSISVFRQVAMSPGFRPATCPWKKNRGSLPNHSTLVHDTSGECLWICPLVCFPVFFPLRFWLYANSNEITWRMQNFALWFRSIATSDFCLVLYEQ